MQTVYVGGVMVYQRVVIVGAGFAGLSAARGLANADVEVLLLNRDNYHTFSPLLHQVAGCQVEPENIVSPIRDLLRNLPNVQFATNDVKRIDLAGRLVEANDCLIHYDYLILACGSSSRFFGVPGAFENAYPLKSLEDSLNLRNRILTCFERAQEEADVARIQQLLTFTIVGGGATGVELAGELVELIYGSLVRDYPRLDLRRVRVLLLQRGERLLPEMPSHLSNYARQKLQKMGVEVRLNACVTQVTENAVYLEDSRVIPCETVVWTAGVQGNRFAKRWGLATVQNGQVKVLPTLQVVEYPEVYVVGDLATLATGQLPMVAPVAIQQGTIAAKNILRQIKGRNPQAMQYRHQGSMVIIGRNVGVANLGKVNLTGFSAWFLWLVIHLGCLPGHRNRLHVLINWIWSYISRERPVRLMLPLDSGSKSTPVRRDIVLGDVEGLKIDN